MLEDDERLQYAARQYQSLREEMGQARQSQQNILQWSQAVSGTLFAAALVAGTGHAPRYVLAAQFVLGLILPAVLLGGALTWTGELIRITRIGVFLRYFESASWCEKQPDPVKATSLFVWQNFARYPPQPFTDSGFRGKQNVGYVGIGLFFGVMYLGSVAAFCIVSSWPLALAASILLIVLGAWVMLPSAFQLFKLNGTSIPVTSKDLTDWLDSVKAGKGAPPRRGTLSRITSLPGLAKRFRSSKNTKNP